MPTPRRHSSAYLFILAALILVCAVPAFSAATADSVTPSVGTGTNQTFTFKFSSTNGYSNLSVVYILINGSLAVPSGCIPYYVPSTNSLFLYNDAGNAVTGPLTPGTPATLSNSQCTISGSGITVSGTGNTLTLTLPIVFNANFQGQQTVFGYAADSNSNSGWQTLGTWTPSAGSNPAPTADSVTPSSGSGTSQNFSFKFSSPKGYTNLNALYVLINGSLSASNGCVPYYVPSSNSIFLFNDAASGVTGPLTPGSNASISNSQCTINGATTSATGAGNTLTLTLGVSFKPALQGKQTIFAYALDNANLNSGWQTLGSWTLAGVVNTPPTADSVTPNSGTGASQNFTFKYSSANGYQSLNVVYALFNNGLTAAAGCIPYYVPASNSIFLFNDQGSGVTGPLTPGSASSISNSQCTISGSGASASGSGNTLSLTLPISFTPAFKGLKTIFGYASDNANQASGWQTLGTWTPPSIVVQPPTADSVTPTGGSATHQAFTFRFSSASGYKNLTAVYALINSSLSAAGGCVPVYVASNNGLYLFNDAGNSVSGPITPGTAGSLANSQCTLSGAASTVSGAGNTLTLTLDITFNPAFTGLKSIFGFASDSNSLDSGWQMLGTWTPTQVVVTLSLSIFPGNIGVTPGNTSIFRVTLSAPAPAGGQTVNLSSSNAAAATVPPFVTIPAGSSFIDLAVTGVAAGSASITASAPNYTSASTLVTVTGGTAPSIVLPANVVLAVGGLADFPVSLTAAAPTGGITVSLTSSDTSKVTITPASVFVPQGSTAATVIPKVSGAGAGSATIMASATGIAGASQQVTVVGSNGGASFQPNTLTITGTSTRGLLVLVASPSPNPVTFNLTSSDQNVANVPSTVTLPANTSTVNVPVTSVRPGTVVIQASSLPGYPATSATVTVVTAASIILPVFDAVGIHNTIQFPVSLSSPAPAGGVTISLTSSDPSKFEISPSVFVPAGATTPSSPAIITAGDLISSEGFSTVTATAPGYTPASLEMHVSDAITLALPFNLSVGVGETKPLPVALPGPAPAGGLTVTITSNNASVATVSATAFIPAGANMPATFPLVTGVSAGTAQLEVTAPGGYISGVQPIQVR